MYSTESELIALAKRCPDRIARYEHQGQFVWVKKKEALSLRLRLQKGNAAEAFERERLALHTLADLGEPVPEILAEGEDFMILPDSGVSLRALLEETLRDGTDHSQEITAGAEALAELHNHHITHGNPRLKDICWKDGKITFLDFERFSSRRNTMRGHAQDVLTFFWNGIVLTGRPGEELLAAREAYQKADKFGVWQRAERLAGRLRFLDLLTKPIQMRPGHKAKEFKAIPRTLEFFGVRNPA